MLTAKQSKAAEVALRKATEDQPVDPDQIRLINRTLCGFLIQNIRCPCCVSWQTNTLRRFFRTKGRWGVAPSEPSEAPKG